ncbi:MAG: cytochrome-c oxidase, cbb3-type subunit III [Rhodospirillaceae bacterium]|nr:cytochrome-c oxidase, cbb3-type subunit III [Rhodospirillaceae bacterium]MBT6119355.1 cytochrome-c oxidase, cbb3-type subunit III [Rhodospirillaceae bacterium]
MVTKVEKDEITGQSTTGHEWDGIKELNTPLPKWWVYTFYACIAFAILWFVLYPAWPGVDGYTKGILGYSQREAVMERVAEGHAAQAEYRTGIAAADLAEIRADPALLNFALAGGVAAFGDNCATCHGGGGAGNVGYPTLADDSWLWGGALEDIHATINYGIRSGHDEERYSEMPRFGADELLEPAQIDDVAEYVLSLTGQETDKAAAERGQEVFMDNCAACHGESGGGDRTQGAPALNDQIWLYGGDKETVTDVIRNARRGVMPAWEGRLSPETVKMLTIYVHALGGGE